MRSLLLLLPLLGLPHGFSPLVDAADLPASKAEPISFGPNDWPWWRGPNRDGAADPKQKPPLTWSASENVLWKVPVPGRGHGSPTMVGDRIFLATADYEKQEQLVLCYDRTTGKQLWQTRVHKGVFEKKGNGKSSLASGSVACDGKLCFINFLHDGHIWVTALNLEGKIVWQKQVTQYLIHQGYGSSPMPYQSLVFVSADSRGKGLVAALDRATGEVVWSDPRPKLPNYATPIVVNIAGKDQLIMIGCNLITSYEPLTGKKNWEIKGSTEECVTSTVTDGQRIFSSGGYPKNHLAGIRADGSGKIDWESNTRIYVPSFVIREGYLYGVLDAGIAMCWKSDTGKEIWRGRLGGTFSASTVLVGELLFATNESGKTFIWKASPNAFELVGENQLGDEAFATPTFCGDRIYFRVAHNQNGKRQEMLYCIGKK